jgi:bifunctional DNA-binding transcriptional regulator/antitoxin component of YhaV-PrlF toxin-antitoxin module
MTAIDRDGRLAAVGVVAALGWRQGTRLDIRLRGGLVLITADPHAVFRVTRPGHVRLPATVRHWCRLSAGSRVLIVADPVAGRLVVYPPATLRTMITVFHAVALDGEAA